MKTIKLIVIIAIIVAITWFVIKPKAPTVQVADTVDVVDTNTWSVEVVEEEVKLTDFENKANITDQSDVADVDTTNAVNYNIADNSKILRYAEKVGGAHNWFINISTANINVVDWKIVAWMINMDLTSLKAVDTAANETLENHLKSADFFDIENYPTSEFKITKVDWLNITWMLTMRWVTKQITFLASKVDVNETSANVMAEFAIDRNQRGVSGWPGMVSDYMQLTVDLTFNK